MSDWGVSRREWLRTVPMASIGLFGSLGSGSVVGSEEESETIVQDTSGSYELLAGLTGSDSDGDDDFGRAMAVSDDGMTVLIGAESDDDSNNDYIGSAYVFKRSGGFWEQQQKLTAPDGDSPDSFGESVAISSDGNTALIGASSDDDPNGQYAGSAYVFEHSDGSWKQQQKLDAADGDPYDSFGWSVTMSSDGNTAIIGAYNDNDPNGEDAGSAYVFERSDGSWEQQQKIAATDGDSSDSFGYSVAVSADGQTALIGADTDDDPNGKNAGSVYVFERSGDSWKQQQKLAAADGDAKDSFGKSIALSGEGTTAVVGADSDNDPNGEDAGSAYVFERSDGSWEQQKLVAEDGDSEDFFGYSVAVSTDGQTALIGAILDEDPNGSDVFTSAGSAYVFERSNGSWEQQQKLAATDEEPDDMFGESVVFSSDGSIAMVGTRDDDVYVFGDSDETTHPPIADAGEDQTVAEEAKVELDATESSDPDTGTLSYSWKQTAGTDVSLSDTDTATPMFTAPKVDTENDLIFELTVVDGSVSYWDSVTISVDPDSPPALPGQETAPRDIDDDDVFEDLNGDGELTLSDAQLYYTELYLKRDSEYVQNHKQYFDLTGNGEITLADVQTMVEKATNS